MIVWASCTITSIFRSFSTIAQRSGNNVKDKIYNMPLFVRSLQTHVLDLSEQKTVKDVKDLVTEREQLPVEQMAVFYEGQPLDDACELVTFRDESTLNIELRLLGGKVHGSLARAGKVRGQTPKVEKQEKKKRRTGRAKRRMQYNRRFVNVVAGFGRKKGPNARS